MAQNPYSYDIYNQPGGVVAGHVGASGVGPGAANVAAQMAGMDYYYHDPITGQISYRNPSGVSSPNGSNVPVRAQTARTLELLRQTTQGGLRQGIGNLRSNLAQRGMMDSGSLGAGITRMNTDANNTMAQGTMQAANNETDRLLSGYEAERQRQFAAEQQARQQAANRSLMELQRQWQLQDRPSGIQQLLGGIGSGVGQGLPPWIASLFHGG